MRTSAPFTTICVVSSNAIAATFLSDFLHTELSAETYVAEDYLGQHRGSTRFLLIVDCTQLDVPLSKYVNRLTAKYPGAMVIVIDSEKSESEIRFVLSLGVHGFVFQNQIAASLVPATESVIAGGIWTPLCGLPAHRANMHRPQHESANSLTYRELEVLELLRKRFSNKEIARALKIKECTAKYHVSNLLGKLQVGRRTDLGASSRSARSVAQIM